MFADYNRIQLRFRLRILFCARLSPQNSVGFADGFYLFELLLELSVAHAVEKGRGITQYIFKRFFVNIAKLASVKFLAVQANPLQIGSSESLQS